MSLTRNSSVARIALVLITLGSACSGASDEHRTFVNRDAGNRGDLVCDEEQTRCRFTSPALTFHDVDGEVAKGGASEGSFGPFAPNFLDAEAECGGVVERASRMDSFEMIEPLQLVLADGSSLQLVPEMSTEISAIGTRCYDEAGRWEGVAGSLRGRSGTYRWSVTRCIPNSL